MARCQTNKAPATFQDVVASRFSEDDWKLLHEWQKDLYKNVMKEIQHALVSLGPFVATAVFSLKADEQGSLSPVDYQGNEHLEGDLLKPQQEESMLGDVIEGLENKCIDRALCTDNPIITSVFSLHSANEEELSFHDKEHDLQQMQNENTATVPVIPSTYSLLKYWEENPLTEITEAENQNTDYGSMYRHQKDVDSSERILTTPSVTIQANNSTGSTQYAQNEDHSESVSWSNSNQKLRQEPKIKCEKEFGNMAYSNLHRAIRRVERPAKQNMDQNNVEHPKSPNGSQKRTSFNHSESVGVMIGLKRYQQAVNSAKIKKRNQCTECGKSFYHKRALIVHKRIHAGGMHQCYACEKSFRMKAHLANHQRIHVKEPTLETQIREENTPDDSQKNVNHGEQSIADTRTDTEEKNISESENHALQSTDPVTRSETQDSAKPFKCDICEKCFGQKVNMLAHLRTHRGEKPYQCMTCNRRYCMKGHLLAHQRARACQKVLNLQKRTQKEKLILSTECKKDSFQNGVKVTNLKHEVRKHKCKDCEKTFHGKASLLAHIRVHTGEKPHQCIICKKCFSQKGYLKIHIRTHTGERPYRCTKCAKGFTTKGNLDSHKRRCVSENIPNLEMPPAKKNIIIQSTEPEKKETQTNIKKPEDERPFKCTVCEKRFHQMGGLVVHSRIHTGEKPYKCSQCDKQFCQKGNLKTHMSTWH